MTNLRDCPARHGPNEQQREQDMDEFAKVIAPGTLRIERLLPGPVERVWDFLTRPERLAGWLGRGEFEPREGASFTLENGHIRGIVTRCRPPRLLSYTWTVFFEGESESR